MPFAEERTSVVLENQGKKIFGVFHRPIIDSSLPAILICHGLAGNKTGKGRLYVLLSQLLAQQGIASLRIDFRGSGDSEGDFADATLMGEVSDSLEALKFIESHPHIDTNRIGIFGRSMGGVVALLTASNYGKIKSLAIWASLFDGHQWLEQWQLANSGHITEDQRQKMMRINGQIPSHTFFQELFDLEMPKELHKLTNIPLLNIHGEQDEVVAIEHAYRYKKAREKSRAYSEFIRLPHSDHDFTLLEEQKIAIEKTCSWFKDTL